MTVKPYNEEQSKKEQVRAMFDNIAPRYDLLNHTLSLNVDRLWRCRVVRILRRCRPHRVLDLATGTGDLAIATARALPGVQVLGVDLSERMLEAARKKVAACGLDGRIVLEQGDGERLALADGAVDAATVAFGVRNFGDLEAGLAEIRRSLRSGGHAVILEFSMPRNALVRRLYGLYSNHVLGPVGGLVSHDREAYDYLPASIAEFPAPDRFLEIMCEAGFVDCKRRSQSLGIAQIYIGRKP